MAARSEPSFLCDAMLGSLARWLRFFGFDCAFADPSLSDEQVVRQVGGRWLVTRDRELASTGPPRVILIRSEELEEQLVEVFSRLGITPEADLGASRCAECNGTLADADEHDVADGVPPYVLRTAERFKRCSDCGRVYWPGTHGDRILERMARVQEMVGR